VRCPIFVALLLSGICSLSLSATAAPDNINTYREKALQGDAEAQTNLAASYELGMDVPKDISEALKWYNEAAAQGNIDAIFALGMMYKLGKDVLQKMLLEISITKVKVFLKTSERQ
jgi:TPR repeat protein